MHNRYIILLFLFFIICCENKPNHDILANVGSRQVTSFEFSETYSNKLINTQLKDSEFERNRHFEFLIRNKLFSEAALRNQLQLDSIAKRYIHLDSIRFLRDELYYEEILNKEINVDETEIRKHYIWSKRECHLKHLFFNNKDDADSIYIILTSKPEVFDSIAFQTFNEEKLKQSRGDLGWIRYNALDPNLEKVGFDMELDEISLPVQSSFGWHILKKLDEKNQMISDEAEFQNNKKRIKNTIIQKSHQIRSDQFVNQIMLQKNILLDDRLIEDVTKALFQLIQLRSDDKILIDKKSEVLKNLITNLRDLSHLPLAKYDDGSFLVQDYIDGIQFLAPQKNQPPQALFYHTLRNQILSQEGGKRGLGDHPNVKLKIQDSRDRFLSQIFLSNLYDGENNIKKEELTKISDSLRSITSIITYQEHLDRLFKLETSSPSS